MAAGSTSDSWAAVRETHSGCVVLLGDRAFKLKKPVALGFLDFTDRTTRRRVCEHEVSLNRRLAPDVYLGVGNLVTPDGVAEPVVVMRRLPESARLSRLVREGADLTTDVRRIARVLAAFHSGAARSPEIAKNGSRQAILSRWDASFEQTRPHAGTMLPAALLDEVETLVHRFLAGRDELFADRIRRGAVVDGHGDLTADDIFCMADGPRLLDCLEFDDTLRHLDRLDDVAFLAMGLEALGAPELGQVLLDDWAELVGDPAPPALVHHFVAYRAFVRAKVACFTGAQLDRPASDQVTTYATMARDHLRSGAVTLVLVGGPPGVGKTTLAVHVAERLGMVAISSDRLRKEAAGIDPQTPAAAAFASGIYSPVHTRATYAEMLRRAGLLLHRGESVVLDASWTDDAERRLAATTAELAHADLVSFRCHLDRAVAAARIRGRAGAGASHRSDADEATAEQLRRLDDPWPDSIAIDMRPSPAACADEACARLRPTRAPATLLRRRPRLAPG
ncbi:hypothetical protein ASC64_07000 [Nocardioides sp. Root122]|uniref:bifunctional aminoglycoside phosphotransferase/ATP-binding protein n=1 Tax=Nocardioides TaxID=1839 RepID=UPI00070276D6|nr:MULTISPECIES: AAA family ATPase [Nocardioides]KQV69587.1 hypothetical protein ASC64_07000 [Nocardioides sp. Root122]MCK9824486.1 AAA family ATPase [Nocardioides cavernae]